MLPVLLVGMSTDAGAQVEVAHVRLIDAVRVGDVSQVRAHLDEGTDVAAATWSRP